MIRDTVRAAWDFLVRIVWRTLVEFVQQFGGILVLAVIRGLGVVVPTGQQGLRFDFGRVGRVLEPGFHPLFPGLQAVRVVPARSRTLDVEEQVVVTRDGLVVAVDASVTWRIDDLPTALTQVTDLENTLLDALAVTIHGVVHRAPREDVLRPGALDAALHEALAARVAVWGVTIESAGFASLSPAGATVRLTQLRAAVETRRRAHAALVAAGLPPRRALAALGPQARFVPRGRGRLRTEELRMRWRGALVGSMRDLGADDRVVTGWERWALGVRHSAAPGRLPVWEEDGGDED